MKRVCRKSGRVIVVTANIVYKILYASLRYGNPKHGSVAAALSCTEVSRLLTRCGMTLDKQLCLFSAFPKFRLDKAINLTNELLSKLGIVNTLGGGVSITSCIKK